MTNSIEFVLKLKNLMGGELTRVGSAAQSTFGRMTNHVNQVTGRNKVLGMSFNEIQRQISNAESTIKNSTIPAQIAFARRELEALRKQASKHPASMTEGAAGGATRGMGIQGVAIGSMLGGIYTRALGMISNGAGAVVQAAFDKEKGITGLTTFLGAEEAAKAYKNILADSEATPFDTNSLLMVNRSLISAGVNAASARETSLDLANAISAVGGGNAELSRMAANMQQIKTVGKATAMDIKQFGMAGINIYEMLARSTGKNISQVKEMEVTYEELQKALAMSRAAGGMYEGALAAQGATDEARINTMREKFVNAGVQIYEAFKPITNILLNIGVGIANSVGPSIQRVMPYIEWISGQFELMINYLSTIGDSTGGWSDYLQIAKDAFASIWQFTINIGLKLWELVSSIMEFVKNSEMIKDIFRFAGSIMENVFAILSAVGDMIIWVWENVIEPILDAMDTAYNWVKRLFSSKNEIDLKVKNPLPELKAPGAPPTIDTFAQSTNMNADAGKSAADTISGGGPKTINISVAKFFDNIQFTTMNGQESAQELERIVLETLARVVYNGSKLA